MLLLAPPGTTTLRACILHADIHALSSDCNAAAAWWRADRLHIPAADVEDAYQAAVERRMLDHLVQAAVPGGRIFTAVKI